MTAVALLALGIYGGVVEAVVLGGPVSVQDVRGMSSSTVIRSEQKLLTNLPFYCYCLSLCFVFIVRPSVMLWGPVLK